jgi:hypothetical protein
MFLQEDGTVDEAIVVAALAVLEGFGLELYAVLWLHQPFNLAEFGAGVGALATGVGVLMGVRGRSRPNPS